ncbi:MAG TPA: cofactor-independent phosphoglycerate mutase [Paludibacteraceae bacterium]|mgnify:CR=1 FL=1|nr:cofactor-independent phosphoglycerate mutase [Paludibacteraceae bacterium]
MKYIVILGDGMADEPIATLGNKTPLQVAHKPTIDKVTQMGQSGLLRTIPEGFSPGSEIANLSVLGYDVASVFEGRGTLEAASIGVPIETDEMVMRCNLICIEDNKIKNHSAGHISNEEAAELITFLQEELGSELVQFFNGVSYRHLCKIKNGDKRITCTPPHDVVGTPFQDVLITAQVSEAEVTAKLLNDLILHSHQLLENHPVNIKRRTQGKDPANSIWFWSPGYKSSMKPLSDLFGIQSGSVISAVDLIKGIGISAGLKSLDVEGATGLFNTNYEGKAQAAIEALKTDDFVFVHVEASDEAGHEGDVDLKIKTIEYLSERLIKPILEAITTTILESVTIAILPDHPTPCRLRTHTADAVPFVIYNPTKAPDEVTQFDEFSVQNGVLGTLKADEFMKQLFSKT